MAKCGVLDRPGTTYVLENDVTSPGTCFSVQADGITLDLNGFTVTYAATEEGATRHGVVGVACWDPNLKGNPCGGSFTDLTVRNGKIVQGPAAGGYSHAIRLGQGRGSGLTVHNVEITVHAPSSVGIYTREVGGGARIFQNKINNQVQKIYDRHMTEGMSIKLAQDRRAKTPNLIYSNTIRGGAQGGIQTDAPGSKIYENDIAQDGRYTNDFCIYVWAPQSEVYANRCHPASGRGIQVDTNGARVYDNVIDVMELARNEEYGGCQSSGAFGIQLERNSRNNEVFRNTVTARAQECDAAAFRATEVRAGTNNRVYENSFTARREGSSGRAAFGASFSAVPGGILFTGNSITADSAAIHVAWEGASGIELVANRFAKGENSAPRWSLVRFLNKRPARVVLVDPVFGESAEDSGNGMVKIGYGDWAGPAEYEIRWTVVLEVKDISGNPVPGASVDAQDQLGNKQSFGPTDAGGETKLILAQLRRFNSPESATEVEFHTPHKLTVWKPGYVAQSLEIRANGPQHIPVKLQEQSNR